MSRIPTPIRCLDLPNQATTAGPILGLLSAISSFVGDFRLHTVPYRVSWVPAPIRCLDSPDEATTAGLILGPLLTATGPLAALRLTLPDRTPLTGPDCTAIAAARGLTRLELLGHASADAVESVRCVLFGYLSCPSAQYQTVRR